MDIEKLRALAKKFREPCGRTVGHGDSCVKGWYCGACSDKAKAADLVDELIAEVEGTDRLLRASVPDRWKDCTSPVGAVQSYIAELEAEVERLRTELAAGAARQGGNTILDGITKYEWWLIDREGDEEYVKVSDIKKRLGAAPAAGTVEKDAAYDVLKSIIQDGYLSDTNTARGHAAIEAHTKAGKDSA
jgi:hypothetical protein